MISKPRYSTKQRKELLSFFASATGEHFTAADVCEYFRAQGRPIGQSTVYRRLESMVDEGILNKYSVPGAPACFEYIGDCGEEACFHCKCEKCGKLYHLHCEELNGLGSHLAKEHSFSLNARRTVFYGLCKDCRE